MDLDDLRAIASKELASAKPIRIRCCTSAGCTSANAAAVVRALEESVSECGRASQIEIREVGCLRLCSAGPLVALDPDGLIYQSVTPEHADSIVCGPRPGSPIPPLLDLKSPFFASQFPIVLENSGLVEPERIESYIALGGYEALYHALRDMSPSEVVDSITRSGLRGRGGAGYPTGVKWATVSKQQSSQKYVICNADEGDPGAFMDRSVLESDPHRVIEGMAIAAYAVGADQGFIYVRGEYPLAIQRLDTAVRQARKLGVLGSSVFESPFNFRIDLRIGAGAFVCGEETALIASIQGQRGSPRPRPPYPAERGLWGCPTLINNVETFANIPPIISRGHAWFASIGTAGSKGTKVFALAGKIRHPGLVEVPMGTTLRQIVEDIGGGAPPGSSIKAVQTGGPSGGCIPAEALDTPVDYESLKQVGSIMGSGGMIVMGPEDNMVDVARYFMEFCMDESCGKCVPCRAGTVQMHRLLSRIVSGQGTREDLNRLEKLCDVVRSTSLCGLGQSAPNPVLSTLHYFRNEYLERLSDAGSTPSVAGPVVPSR